MVSKRALCIIICITTVLASALPANAVDADDLPNSPLDSWASVEGYYLISTYAQNEVAESPTCSFEQISLDYQLSLSEGEMQNLHFAFTTLSQEQSGIRYGRINLTFWATSDYPDSYINFYNELDQQIYSDVALGGLKVQSTTENSDGTYFINRAYPQTVDYELAEVMEDGGYLAYSITPGTLIEGKTRSLSIKYAVDCNYTSYNTFFIDLVAEMVGVVEVNSFSVWTAEDQIDPNYSAKLDLISNQLNDTNERLDNIDESVQNLDETLKNLYEDEKNKAQADADDATSDAEAVNSLFAFDDAKNGAINIYKSLYNLVSHTQVVTAFRFPGASVTLNGVNYTFWKDHVVNLNPILELTSVQTVLTISKALFLLSAIALTVRLPIKVYQTIMSNKEERIDIE